MIGQRTKLPTFCAALALALGVVPAFSDRLPHYDVQALHRLLVIPDVAKATTIEHDLERAGGVLVTGIVGDTAMLPDGQFHVWLRTATDDELIARFALPVAVAKGRAVELHCPAPRRSYALVIGECRIR